MSCGLSEKKVSKCRSTNFVVYGTSTEHVSECEASPIVLLSGLYYDFLGGSSRMLGLLGRVYYVMSVCCVCLMPK